MQEIIPGVYTWSIYSDKKGYYFNGFAVKTQEGTVLIDPPEKDEAIWSELEDLKPINSVFVTNRNHSREAEKFAERFDAPLKIHESDEPDAEASATATVNGGEYVCGEIEILHLPGKSPGEIGFYLASRNAVIVGDVVIGVPDGELSTYPDEVVDDREELLSSAQKLLRYDFDSLLLCDGKSFVKGGKAKLEEFVDEQLAAIGGDKVG